MSILSIWMLPAFIPTFSVAAALTLKINKPWGTYPYGDSLYVEAAVTTTSHDIKSVRARLEGLETTLKWDSVKMVYAGNLFPKDLPSGPATLAVKAEDAGGETIEKTVAFRLDRPPTIKVDYPRIGQFIRPELPIKASCTDREGPCRVRVVVTTTTSKITEAAGGAHDFIAPGFVDTVLQVRPYIAYDILVQIWGVDSSNQATFGHAPGFAMINNQLFRNNEATPGLVRKDSLSGLILDMDSEWILYAKRYQTAALLNRKSRAEKILAHGGELILFGSLTPHGALFGGDSSLYEWDTRWGGDSARPLVSKRCCFERAAVRGRFAAWTGDSLYRKDLTTGTVKAIYPGRVEGFDLDSFGNAAFILTDKSVYRYEAAGDSIRKLGLDVSSRSGPILEGPLLAYMKIGGGTAVAMHEGGLETVLREAEPAITGPYVDYRTNSGWIAYTRAGNTGSKKTWLRDPAGVRAVLEIPGLSGKNNRIDGLNPAGAVMVKSDSGSRYLVGTQGASRALFPKGRSWWVDGKWMVAINGYLFEVDTSATADIRRSEVPRLSGDGAGGWKWERTRSGLSLSFEVFRDSKVGLALFDVGGHQLWAVAPRRYALGHHQVRVDGLLASSPGIRILEIRREGTVRAFRLSSIP